jgi:hypothetical protein
VPFVLFVANVSSLFACLPHPSFLLGNHRGSGHLLPANPRCATTQVHGSIRTCALREGRCWENEVEGYTRVMHPDARISFFRKVIIIKYFRVLFISFTFFFVPSVSFVAILFSFVRYPSSCPSPSARPRACPALFAGVSLAQPARAGETTCPIFLATKNTKDT